MGVVRVKDGVLFNVIAPGGFRILNVLDNVSHDMNLDLVITSGTDGEHSGPDDPHHRGEAYDIRCHDLPDKDKVLERLISYLESFGDRFFAFIEAPGTENEHIHIQVKKGTVYP